MAVLCLCAIASAKTPRPLANIPIQTPDRKNISLKKYHGKVVFVVLFLTDCADCIKMVNFASQLQTDYASRGLQVIGAAVDDKAPYLVTPFVQRYRPNFPVGYLAQTDLVKFLDLAPDVRPIAPMVMFIDSNGTVRNQYYGKDTAFFADNYRTLRLITQGLLNQKDGKERPYNPAK
jgi:hypothetical protein